MSRGRLAFERRLGYRVPWRVRFQRAWRADTVLRYLGAIGFLTALILAGPLFVSWSVGAILPSPVLLGLVAVVPASDIAVALVHRLVTALVPPRLLCKLELADGVPAELRTMVVVPTLLSSRAAIQESVERLQVHFLANPAGHLHFALLTDWQDAPRERMPGDEDLLTELAEESAQLNKRYPSPPVGGERFMVLHRRRLWNEQEGKWIGWERKRGKLHELNRLLRGASDTTFIPINGKMPTVPDGVRYVITLDADTRLPRTTARRLVGAMAHPLNRPRVDADLGRVVEGYAILQPRIVPSLPTGPASTTYQRIVSGPGGVDPYAGAVSDVYQDLFGEGSYTGKGIYDVDAFETVLAGRVPENALLSHDLFEGIFGWIGILDTACRLEATLETMTDLRRFHGHFVNWYDTRDLCPLDPLYISTVDSGNLAGHLIALSQGCRQLIRRPLVAARVLDGIRDALQPVLDTVEKTTFRPRSDSVTALQVREAAKALSVILEDLPASASDWAHRFEELEARAEDLLDIAHTLSLTAESEEASEGLTRKRFYAHPMIQAADLLLQERTPRAVAVTRPRGQEVQVAHVRDLVPPALRRFESPHDVPPRTHLLSNGRYVVMVTSAGSGFSRWHDLAVTRWREDTTRDCWGTFLFMRDAETGAVWSAGFQPSGTEVDQYRVEYAEDRAKIVQRDRSLSTTLEIVVSPEDDAELRQLTGTNLENRDREIDVTSYAEVVLASQAADEAHPAFSNLFVETEFIPELQTLLATRRPRSAAEPQVWLAHLAAIDGDIVGACEYESDRAKFLGRGRGIRTPLSIIESRPLTNTVGTILDPIVSLRYRISIPPGETASLVFTTLIAPSREEAVDLAEKYRHTDTFERESALAWMYAQVQLHHLQITQDEAHLFQRLANRMLYDDRRLRTVPENLVANHGGAPRLWAYGISGDLPIAVVRIERDEERDVARQMLRAHEYRCLKGMAADLVILNGQGASYAQGLQEFCEAMVRATQTGVAHEGDGKQGDVFVLREDLLPPEDVVLLYSAARVLILASRGTLSEQVIRLPRWKPGSVATQRSAVREDTAAVLPPAMELEFFNGLGGFTPDGREYVTVC